MTLPFRRVDVCSQNWFVHRMTNAARYVRDWMMTMNMDAHHGCECDLARNFCRVPRGNYHPSAIKRVHYVMVLTIAYLWKLWKRMFIIKINCCLPDSLRDIHRFGIPRSKPISLPHSPYQHSFLVCIVRIFLVPDSIVSLDTPQSHLDRCYSNVSHLPWHHSSPHKPAHRLVWQLPVFSSKQKYQTLNSSAPTIFRFDEIGECSYILELFCGRGNVLFLSFIDRIAIEVNSSLVDVVIYV